MKCPYCKISDSKVVDKRDAEDSEVIRRRRECLKCGKRFTTYERVELADIRIIKKDGRRELFDRNKLLKGILKACEKRPISDDRIKKLADEIETNLRRREKTEIESKVIGELVIEKLKRMDKVAYIRFASVYRQFKDIGSFEQELKKLNKRR
jgi:transcriptional repressor NrdR